MDQFKKRFIEVAGFTRYPKWLDLPIKPLESPDIRGITLSFQMFGDGEGDFANARYLRNIIIKNGWKGKLRFICIPEDLTMSRMFEFRKAITKSIPTLDEYIKDSWATGLIPIKELHPRALKLKNVPGITDNSIKYANDLFHNVRNIAQKCYKNEVMIPKLITFLDKLNAICPKMDCLLKNPHKFFELLITLEECETQMTHEYIEEVADNIEAVFRGEKPTTYHTFTFVSPIFAPIVYFAREALKLMKEFDEFYIMTEQYSINVFNQYMSGEYVDFISNHIPHDDFVVYFATKWLIMTPIGTFSYVLHEGGGIEEKIRGHQTSYFGSHSFGIIYPDNYDEIIKSSRADTIDELKEFTPAEFSHIINKCYIATYFSFNMHISNVLSRFIMFLYTTTAIIHEDEYIVYVPAKFMPILDLEYLMINWREQDVIIKPTCNIRGKKIHLVPYPRMNQLQFNKFMFHSANPVYITGDQTMQHATTFGKTIVIDGLMHKMRAYLNYFKMVTGGDGRQEIEHFNNVIMSGWWDDMAGASDKLLNAYVRDITHASSVLNLKLFQHARATFDFEKNFVVNIASELQYGHKQIDYPVGKPFILPRDYTGAQDDPAECMNMIIAFMMIFIIAIIYAAEYFTHIFCQREDINNLAT